MLSFLGRRSVAAIAGMSRALAGLAAVASTATAACKARQRANGGTEAVDGIKNCHCLSY